ncbi:DUF397 domain-containing protein [Thermobifida halotolerans]|uniref:DUF397 domain-containing protein n=1 Tax=Thermobifida halotolerans TaxID=483545 RepID=A0A399FXT2_9ACTN|nr:DUF397 domain-containing protein [Thermobifida halotolerans]UOE21410.1 DUF397 domain-containing protein [Thermobifida halotolerans]
MSGKLLWRKSSFSSGSGNRVEFAERGSAGVLVRGTRHRESGPLDFTASAWSEFLAEIKAGRL